MVSEDAKWHINKRNEILKKYPEVKNLEGENKYSLIYIIFLSLLQFLFSYLIEYNSIHYMYIALFSWLNANTFYYSLSTFIHENSHGLILGWKKRELISTFIEAGVLTFGEQWEYTNVHYYLHHPHLNDKDKDSECPGIGHVAYSENNYKKYIYPIIELLPLGFLLTINPSNNSQNKSYSSSYIQKILLIETIIIYVIYFFTSRYRSILFSIWTLSFYVSRWCIALHGQSIAEHYSLSTSSEVPTMSTYLFYENLIGFNTGYHNEHHTFPNISWNNLPKLKSIAPEYFKDENKHSYISLWFYWAKNLFAKNHFRICLRSGNNTN